MSSVSVPPCVAPAASSDASEGAGNRKDPSDEREEQAHRLLADAFGASAATVATGEACGVVGVQARQTNYSDGFALLLPTHLGTTVALRQADTSRVVFAPDGRVWTGASASAPAWVRVAHRVVEVVCEEASFEVGVVSSVPPGCRDGYWASLAVALVRAVQSLGVPTVLDTEQPDVLRDALVPRLATEVAQATEQPYGPAYLLATFAGAEPPATLVDTGTREYLPVRTDARTALRWALVDPVGGEGDSGERLPAPAVLRRRKDQAEAALARLRREGFEGLSSFRNLEHRDLERATRALPPPLQPIVRHLVTENRRVQKHVAALRRADWQMVGALLLMSHASLRDDWGGATPTANALVEAVEAHTHDGLYGACMTERGGAVLVVGRPHVFEEGLRELTRTVAAPQGAPPTVHEL